MKAPASPLVCLAVCMSQPSRTVLITVPDCVAGSGHVYICVAPVWLNTPLYTAACMTHSNHPVCSCFRVAPARIACLDMNLQKARMQMGVQVLVNDPKELENIRQREADITKERIEKILNSGANVVLTSKGIDDMALKYFVEAGVLAVRRVPKDDLK